MNLPGRSPRTQRVVTHDRDDVLFAVRCASSRALPLRAGAKFLADANHVHDCPPRHWRTVGGEADLTRRNLLPPDETPCVASDRHCSTQAPRAVLGPEDVVAITRWLKVPPLDCLKLFATAI